MINTIFLGLLVIIGTILLWIVAMRLGEITDQLHIHFYKDDKDKLIPYRKEEWIVEWTDGGTVLVDAIHIGLALSEAQYRYPSRTAKSIRIHR